MPKTFLDSACLAFQHSYALMKIRTDVGITRPQNATANLSVESE
jgi:hypothetical protein